MVQIPRGDLGILGTSKGLIIGNVSFKMFSGETIDCKGGQCIPSEIDDILEIEINEFEDATKVVIVVEKDAVFQKIINEDFTNFIRWESSIGNLISGTTCNPSHKKRSKKWFSRRF